MECLAVIPARGGSKGIPRKNVLPLAGKPLIAYNIEQAFLSHLVTRVVVSTDDAEIGAVARQFGAEVVWRPAEISGDTASSEAALLHVLEYLETTEAYQPDLLVFLQCTSPLTLAQDIDGTIQALLDQGADTSLAVTPFHYFLWQSREGDAVGINHDKAVRLLRQQREPQYLETGAVYVMKAPGFRSAGHRFFGCTAMYVIPPERRLEIDDPVDFDVAQVLLSQQHARQVVEGRGGRTSIPAGPAPAKPEPLPQPVGALILDFDGVFTDNRVLVMQDGREAVWCSRADGWGIARLKQAGVPILILSTETNPVVQARADKLGLPCLQGQRVKWDALAPWLADQGIDPGHVVYVGNDVNDLDCMQHVGCAVAVADSAPEVLQAADLILAQCGGNGAIREICDRILHLLPAGG